VEARVARRDSVFGVVRENGETVILAQGDEQQSLLDYTKLINVLYDSGAELGDAHSEIVEFGRTVPPIKKIMVNGMLLFISVLAGMLIAMNILEEKSDKTVAAINVSPVPRGVFILGKSLTGMIFALVISAVCILITGFYDINIGQTALVILATTVLSLVIGFSQGISSNDVMEAAGSVKLMFLPLAASVVGYELLSAKWQFCLYWSPFYWAYRANDLILSGGGTWPELLLYVAIILVICGAVTAALAPHIRKGLQ
jgi:ABC-type Na+ efflux pump permease subunit